MCRDVCRGLELLLPWALRVTQSDTRRNGFAKMEQGKHAIALAGPAHSAQSTVFLAERGP
jgi:hypothetical protein